MVNCWDFILVVIKSKLEKNCFWEGLGQFLVYLLNGMENGENPIRLFLY